MPETLDCVVVGAGVVGLAVAREFALAGREVTVLEAAETIGSETSSRNSEVIHAGIYYPPGSLKAQSCVAGREALYDFCRNAGVPHRRLGKLIVATEETELAVLDRYRTRAAANGAGELERLTPAQAARREPRVHCVGALWSPNSGIVDSHQYMLALQGELEAHGGMVVLRSPVTGGRLAGGRITIDVGDRPPYEVACRTLINCAGLHAQDLCTKLGLPEGRVPRRYLSKGHYYSYSGPPPFAHLVYPVADHASLGIHATCDLAGQIRFGPDVTWLDRIDYAFDERTRGGFVEAIARYFPDLEPARLQPGYTGIRPKLVPAGSPPGDFVIAGAGSHGITGLINLFGIESPGLTASLALARQVRQSADADEAG